MILDHAGRPLRWVSPGTSPMRRRFDVSVTRSAEAVSIQSTLQDALEALLAESNASTVVTGRRGEYVGLITIDTLVGHLSEMREEHAHDHDEEPDPSTSGLNMTATTEERAAAHGRPDAADLGRPRPPPRAVRNGCDCLCNRSSS